MKIDVTKIMAFLLFTWILVCALGQSKLLKQMFKHTQELMSVDTLLKFKMISANHENLTFEQAEINSDMYFVKYKDRIELLGTENYRPGHPEFYDSDDELNQLEKQFLADFAAQQIPLRQYNFAADWRLIKKDFRPEGSNTFCLYVIANEVGGATTGKLRIWEKKTGKYDIKNYDPYDNHGDINDKNDNITKMLLQKGKKLTQARWFPTELSRALSIGQKSAIHVLQNNNEMNVNEQVEIGVGNSHYTPFEYAVAKDMLLVVDEMLKYHCPKLDKTSEGSTILHLATSENMLRLLVKSLKEKDLLETVLNTCDAGGLSFQTQYFARKMSGKCSSFFNSVLMWIQK